MAIFPGSAIPSAVSDYEIDNSCRFNGTGTGTGGDYLTRTTTTAGSGTWTLSTWVKISNLSDGTWSSGIFGAHQGSTATQIYIESNDKIRWYEGGGDINPTARVFRDPSAWYHLVFQKDADTSMKIYVNGELTDTNTSSVPATSPATNSGATVYIGQAPALDGTRFASFCGYQAEVYFVDGSVLEPSDFGELDSDTNQWKPLDSDDVKDAVTFGTNGFYQKYNSTELATSFNDSSSSDHTITANGDATNQRPQHHNVTANGDAHLIGPKVGTSSIVFDGTGDYLSTPDSTDWVFGTGDFTLEAWVNINGSAGEHTIFSQRQDGSNEWNFILDTNNERLKMYNINVFDCNSSNGTVPNSISVDRWVHCAAVRSSGTITLYANGVGLSLSTNTTPGGNWVDMSGDLRIGDYNGTAQLDGYMEGLRISNTARYTADFTPPTSTFTNDSNTKLLIQSGTDGSQTFDDLSTSDHTITANGDARWFAPKVGAGAMAFDGTGDYFKYGTDVADFEFGAGDFTVECWMQKDSGSSYEWDNCAIAYGDNTAAESSWKIYAPDYIEGYVWSGTTAYNVTATTDTDDNAWHHVALARDGATLRLYIDGTQEDTVSVSGVTLNSHSSAQMVVGWDAGSAYYTGYLDDVRVSSFCRYPDGTTFTPSTTMLTDDINTVLLLNADINQGTWAEDTSTGLAISTDSRMKFDGTGDYLSAPDSSDWSFGTGDFTLETWVNFNDSAGTENLFNQYQDASNRWYLSADLTNNTLAFYDAGSGMDVEQTVITWAAGVWYHVAMVRDSGTVAYYVNGTEYTVTGTSPGGNIQNNTGSLLIGQYNSGDNLNGYMDEIRISDSARYTSAFTPQTRGNPFTADANTKLLIHSDYTGGLGADSSGNYNNFTATNLVATDQMVDSPTNSFCTLNSVDLSWSYATGQTIGPPTLSEGNLRSTKTSGSGGYEQARGTIAVDSGKWYFEMLLSAVGSSNHQSFGICTTSTDSLRNWGGGQSTQWTYQNDGGTLNGSGADSGFSTYTTGDVVSCAFDADAGKIWWAKNGTWEGSGNPATGANARYTNVATQIASDGNSVSPFSVLYSSSASEFFNFGSDSSFAGAKTAQGNQDGNGVGDFYYEPPSGFLALCTDNLSDPEIKLPEDYFGTSTWSALSDGSAQSISQISFQPDWVWIKQRNGTYDHMLFDSVRGATKYLESNDNAIEATDAQTLTSFNSDGFSLGTANTVNGPNASNSYVGWAWKGGGAGVENTEGNITSSVSANTTAGFSVVKYTGSGNTSSTVGHGLSQAPELIIIKNLDESQNWKVGNDRIGTSPTADAWAQYKYLELNDGDAVTHDNDVWRTAPSATVFHLWQGISVNQSTKNFIAYCMHPVENYSKIGIYDGNNDNDGVFIYLGFKPEFFLAKNIDATESWEIWDGTREPYNKLSKKISPNTNDAEYTANTTTYAIDFLSNGVKLRTNYSAVNASNSFLFYAVAKNPFKYSNAR